MEAMNVLMDEHRAIERVLNSLEAGVNLLESGAAVRPGFFLSATEFFRGFADGCHHKKEEGILFNRMTEQGIELSGCPLGVMLAEHEAGRQYTRALTSAAEDLQKGNESARERVIMSSRSYIQLLRLHIFKEDTFLFPMATEVIPEKHHASLVEDFERIEQFELGEGVHEKYHALVGELEAEASQF